MFIAALFKIAKAMESGKMLHNWWMDKENVVLIHNGNLLSHKEEWNFNIRE
jgi:hypothetical protein